MNMSRFRLAGVVFGATLAALSMASPLFAQDQSAPQPSQQPGPGQGRGGRGGGMGMMFGPGGGGTMGKVTAITGNELTIKDDQGQVFKVETGPNSRIRKNREEAKITDIHVGDTIMAAGYVDDQAKTIGAMFVSVLTPEQAAEAEKRRAEFGKTWTAGKITAIKDLTVTIERPDKVTQTVTVDENTTFKRGARGEAADITFPDIKVGQMLRADGALKDGSFLATNLVVSEPRQPGEGRGGYGGRPGAPGGPGAAQPQTPPSTNSTPPQPPSQD